MMSVHRRVPAHLRTPFALIFGLVLVLGGFGAAPRVSAQKPLSSAECAQLLQSAGYRASTRSFADLRRFLRSDAYSGKVAEFVDGRHFQLAIWELRLRGQNEWAGLLEGHLRSILMDSPIYAIRSIPGTSQPTQIELQGGVRAVFKPHRSHYAKNWEKREVGWLSNPKLEVIAYELDRILGLGMVPMTVEREIGGIHGSLQVWVERSRRDTKLIPGDLLHRMHVFDYLIRNQDRREANLFFDSERLVLVDHGVILSPTYFGWMREFDPTTARVFSKRAPDDLLRALRLELTDSALGRLLEGSVEPSVIEGVKKRRDELIAGKPSG